MSRRMPGIEEERVDRDAGRSGGLAEAVLRWLLSPMGGAGEAILGDLRQERNGIARDSGEARARVWYRRQAFGVGWRAVRDRLRRRGPFHGDGAGDNRAPGRRGEAWKMKEFVGDIRYAFRSLSRAKQYALVAVLTLAAAVAANTVVFTVLNSVLLQPLPYVNADRLMTLRQSAPGLGYPEFGISPGLYYQYRENASVLEASALFRQQTVNLTGDAASPERVSAVLTTHTLFETLGSQPALGRGFRADEDVPDGRRVAVLSHSLWSGRYGGDPSIVGRSIRVDGAEWEIVGVMPESFGFPSRDDALYLPLRIDLATASSGNFAFQAVARVRPGATVDELRGQLDGLIARLPEFFPDDAQFLAFVNAGRLASVAEPLKEAIVGDLKRPLWLLLGTAGFVLLIACANVTNLFLVRAEARYRDIAVRSALGAGRFRLSRYFLAESLVLSVAAGAVGTILGVAGVAGLVHAAPPQLPRLSEVGIDAFGLAYSGALIILVALLLAVLPAWRLTAPSVLALVSRSGFRTTTGRDRFRARQALVILQTALALVLLTGSALMLRTFAELRSLDPGFDADGVLTFRLTLPPTTYTDAEQVAYLHERVLERLRAIPGVQAAGGAAEAPLTNSENGTAFSIEDHPVEPDALPPMLWYTYATDGYFDAMRIPVLAGEVPGPAGREANRRAVVVSRKVAERFWPGTDPIGRRLGPAGTVSGPWFTIVGVVGDVRTRRLQDEPEGMIYFPTLSDLPPADSVTPAPPAVRSLTYTVRAARPESLSGAVRDAVWSIDPNLPIAAVNPMKNIVAESMVQTSFTMIALVIAAALALFLGAIGLYGVISYLVTQRTREIGLRMALGAEARSVRRMVAWQGFRLAVLGLALGIAAAFGLTRLLESLLFGTRPADPLTFAAVTALLGGVAYVASWLPALRASRLDPARTLQSD